MAIKLRTDQSVELTYQEADENFSSLFYSASISGNTLSLYYTGSSFAPTTNPVNIALPTSEGSRWTASLGGSISRSSNISVVGSISATGAVTSSLFKVIGGNSGQILTADGTVATAGTNITISGGTISATDTNTTYTAGAGLTLTGTAFALDETLHYRKMVPYTVVEYYGSLTAFDSTGAGTGAWTKIYLCNGNNGTPDKRGVVGVGVTDGTMKGGTMPAATAPGGGNPTYTLSALAGSNTVTLSEAQMPAHDHAGSAASSTTSAHHHLMFEGNQVGYIGEPTNSTYVAGAVRGGTNSQNYTIQKSLNNQVASIGKTSDATATTTTTITLASQGGGQAHSNYQPGLGCYYIMHIPS